MIGREEKRFWQIFLFLIILLLGVVSATTCSITTSCNADNTVMRLSTTTNAHGGLYSQTNYNQYLCCDFTGTHKPDGQNKVIGLSAATNAHAEIPSLNNYGTPVYFGKLSCTSGVSCPSGYPIGMLSLSSQSNAHLGSFSTYSTKICCCNREDWTWTNNYRCVGTLRQREQKRKICPESYEYQWIDYACESDETCQGEGVCIENCKFTNAFWNPESATEQDSVAMIISGTNCDSKNIRFDIYEDDLIGDDFVTTVNSIYDRGIWAATWQDDGGGNPEYYFRATSQSAGSSTKTSNLLEVSTLCGNGVVSGSELCDDGSNNGVVCSPKYSSSCTYCSSSCNSITLQGLYCGDGIINGLEECDDGNSINRDGCSNECKIECLFNSARWSTTSATEGDNVAMIIGGTNCNGKSVSFKIYEDDLVGDDLITTISGTFDRGTWTTQWVDDSGGNPEYYFQAILEEDTRIEKVSGLLSVSPLCGNGVVSGSELCDDGSNNGVYGYCNLECTGAGEFCGDGGINGLEVCDDGANNGQYSYCKADCSGIGPSMGDGIINGLEECDDGNLINEDGCSSTGQLETEIFWIDKSGNKIGNDINVETHVGETIKLIWNNTGLSPSTTFEIYENDLIGSDYITTINGIFSSEGNGIVTGEWTITQEDYEKTEAGDVNEFFFKINSEESNYLTILPEDHTEWCMNYDEESGCASCDYSGCNAAANSVNIKVFEAFPEQWGDTRCGENGVECFCGWDSNTNTCSYGLSIYPSIGKCTYQEDTADTCEDGFLEYSWDGIWEWGANNGYNSYTDGPSPNEGDYVLDGTTYYYDPNKTSAKCVGGNNVVPCPAQIQIPFFGFYNLIGTLLFIGMIYGLLIIRTNKILFNKSQRKKSTII